MTTYSATDYYEVRWREKNSDEAWSRPVRCAAMSEIVVTHLERDRVWEIEVRSVSHCGAKSIWVSSDYTVPTPPLPDAGAVGGTGVAGGVDLDWTPGDGGAPRGDLQYELQRAPVQASNPTVAPPEDDPAWVRVAIVAGTTWHDQLTDTDAYWYRVRTINYAGQKGPWSLIDGPAAATVTLPNLQSALDATDQAVADAHDAADAAHQTAADAAAGVQQEVSDRQAAVTDVTQQVQGVSDALDQEVSDRQAAVGSIAADTQSNAVAIAQEAQARINALAAEAQARANAVTGEANAREMLAAQLRGGYSGSDLAQVTTGLIASEKAARTTQYQGLATQMTLLSAGVGEQFDSAVIWYFNQSTEEWTTTENPNGSMHLSWEGSWVRMPNTVGITGMVSPVRTIKIVDGVEYNQLRLRVKRDRSGRPWAGSKVWWKEITPVQWIPYANGNALPDGQWNDFILNDGANKFAQPGQDAQANISAMYLSDDQGRWPIFSVPRTNLYADSEMQGLLPASDESIGQMSRLSDLAWPAGITHGMHADAGRYGPSYWHSHFAWEVGTYTLSCFVRMDDGAAPTVGTSFDDGCDVCFVWASAGARPLGEPGVQALANGIYRITQTVQVTAASSNACGLRTGLYKTRTYTFAGFQVERGEVAGRYIPTDAAPASVTDYAISYDGRVTFAEPPAVGAMAEWEGTAYLSWTFVATLSPDWLAAASLPLPEPAWDEDGIGQVMVTVPWPKQVAQLRIDLPGDSAVDWIAIGRPAPGASSASVAEETTARATADVAEASARETLSVRLTGTTDLDGITLDTLTSGLLYEEKTTRATADSLAQSQITVLQGQLSTVDGNVTANATAIDSLQTDLSVADGKITSNTTALTNLQNSVTALDGSKADSSALSSLQSTVSSQGDDIDANTLSITSLQTGLAGKADSSALSSLQSTVSSQGDDIDANTTSITSLQTGLAGKADSSALSSLQSTVSSQGGTISSHGSAITAIQSRLPAGTGALASADAVSSLGATVSSQGDDIDANTVSITSLQTGLAGKADSSALSSLQSTVTSQGGRITANASAIQSVAVRMPSGSGSVATASSVTAVQNIANSASAKINAAWTIKLDVGGRVSGVVAQNNGATSSFAVLADQFSVQSSGSGARTVYENECWKIYADSSGIPVVELGKLS